MWDVVTTPGDQLGAVFVIFAVIQLSSTELPRHFWPSRLPWTYDAPC